MTGALFGRGAINVAIARLAQVEGDPSAAVDALTRAVRLNPNDPYFHKELALAHASEGHVESAFCELMAALLIDPRDATTHAAIGQLFLDAERDEDAVRAFNRALTLKPDASKRDMASPPRSHESARRVRPESNSSSSSRRAEAHKSSAAATLPATSSITAHRSGRRPVRRALVALVLVSASGLVPHADTALPQFVDITQQAGITFRHTNGASADKHLVETMGSGGLFFDYDGDGWIDIFIVDGGSLADASVARRAQHRLYHNRGGATFEDVTERWGSATASTAWAPAPATTTAMDVPTFTSRTTGPTCLPQSRRWHVHGRDDGRACG